MGGIQCAAPVVCMGSHPRTIMTPTAETRDTSRRAVSILARSLFRQMRDQGYAPEQIIALSSELIELVSTDLRQERAMDARWAAE